MRNIKKSTTWSLVAMVIIVGPIYIVELLHIDFFATTKIAGIPSGGFLVWIYYLVVAVMSLIIALAVNAGERR
jgi:hypothetical protein